MKPQRRRRRGVATVELAVLLPLLVFLFVIGVDFARAFIQSQIVAGGARNSAIWASENDARAADSVGIRDAAMADMTDLDPVPTVTSVQGVDSAGDPYVRVTVDYRFDTVTSYPGVTNSFTIRRVCQARIKPVTVKTTSN